MQCPVESEQTETTVRWEAGVDGGASVRWSAIENAQQRLARCLGESAAVRVHGDVQDEDVVEGLGFAVAGERFGDDGLVEWL